MKIFVGIDLGSTTTKSVVLDRGGHILGRGITNSRSNYDIACDVARGEALMDARFHIFGELLAKSPKLSQHKDEFLELLRRNFRLEQYLLQLRQLGENCRVHAEKPASGMSDTRIVDAVTRLFAALEKEAAGLYAAGKKPKSDFFRDLASSRYSVHARTISRSAKIEFEDLIAIYDKSILTVENTIGSTWFQEMLLAAVQRSMAEYHDTDLQREFDAALAQVLAVQLVEVVSVGTGYGRARLPFPKERIRSEILCHGLGAHALFPNTRTVLDIGGQDTKAIQVDEHGIVSGFQMNDRCAAGCGRYLGYIAEEMNIGLQELGPIAMEATREVRINSTCTVFAGAELRDRLANGQRREDILAGLHRAIVLRAMSLLSRSGGVQDEFTFTGGVAKNPAAVRALRALVAENYGERTINISPDSIYMGALGAAIFALREEQPGADYSAEQMGELAWS